MSEQEKGPLGEMTDEELYDYADEWQEAAQREYDSLRGENPDVEPVEEANTQMRLAWAELERRGLPRPPRP